MRRWIPLVLLALVGSACSGADPTGAPTPAPSATSPSPTPAETPTDSAVPEPHPVSLPALRAKGLRGGELRLGAETAGSAQHRQYVVTYRSGGLTVSGRLAVPNGEGPFPAVVLAHGYIDPAVYVNGQGMTRERAWFADRGYVALHVDYRGHAQSSSDRSGGLDMRMGYTEDVLNAVTALRAWDGPVDDDRIALVGRSMGGGIVYNALAVRPGLVDAAVVFAPVSSDAVDNFDHFVRGDAGRGGAARRILRRYGTPREAPAFWRGISARTYFADITEPVLIHHGTSDDTCPIAWSRATARSLRAAGVDVTLRTYPGENHAFGPQWGLSMARTDRFLRTHLSTG